MFRVKICGIKDPETAEECVKAGADAIGLNFYAQSKRFVADSEAKQISNAVGANVLRVGLFVNETAEAIAEKVDIVGLDALQLHGDEKTTFVAQLRRHGVELPILRAVRISAESPSSALEEIEIWSSGFVSESVSGILLDAKVDGSYGGTGNQIDWNWLRGIKLPTRHPVLLAGGLNPQNVSDAIEKVAPHGVDVAGGVENENGDKDFDLIRQFVENARHLFDRN